MIGLNPLRTNVLITIDEVLFHAPTDKVADPRIILSNIIIAERRLIKPNIGEMIYHAFLEKKNKVVTTSNKSTLQSELNNGRSAQRETITLTEGDIVNSDSWLDSNQKLLWNNYLHKLTAECVYFVSLPVNRARFTAKGVEKNNPEAISQAQDSVSIELKELKHLMDVASRDRISPLISDIHNYLCKVNYPGYCRDCTCDADGVAYLRKSDIIFGMYDD